MGHTINKLIFIMIGFMMNVYQGFQPSSILPFLLVLTISFGMDVMNKKWLPFMMPLYCILLLLVPELHYYLPVFIYDDIQKQRSSLRYLPLLLICMFLFYQNVQEGILLACFVLFAIFFKARQIKGDELLALYKKQRDSTKEVSLLMEDRQKELLKQQEYEIRLATLHERNRIAREIHDNVGHLLSSSLLQVGALQAINTQTNMKESIDNLHGTLNNAMTSIRSSVHDLHEDSLDLKMECKQLITSFTFAPVTFTYEVELKLKREVIYQILAIVKEALHNIMKHSNATQVTLCMREQPKFLQLIIKDNGTILKQHEPGIGLHNIEQRVMTYHGLMNLHTQDGFQIFITLPKEEIS